MSAENYFIKHKQSILDRWQQLVVSTYHEQTSLFLQRERDRFANPVGAAIAEMASSVIEELTRDDFDGARLSFILDNFIKIRAVQEFSPSEAVTFIFLLKQAVSESMLKSSSVVEDYNAVLSLHARIDRIALLTFDKYVECREKLLEIRLSEFKRSCIRPRNSPHEGAGS